MNIFHSKLVSKAMDNDHKLTEWEFNFINDLAVKDERYNLTEKQIEILHRIDKKVSFE